MRCEKRSFDNNLVLAFKAQRSQSTRKARRILIQNVCGHKKTSGSGQFPIMQLYVQVE